MIVATQSYETTDATIDSQILQLELSWLPSGAAIPRGVAVVGSLSLFDAVPFLAFPHFVAPRPFCVIGPEKEKRNRAKE